MNNDEIDKLKTLEMCMIEGGSVRHIRKVMKRLYSENRMSGDDMRDHAQLLQYVIDHIELLEDKKP